MKIHFGHRVGNTTPSTELPRDFCAGIGPLQLDVVLVFFYTLVFRFRWCVTRFLALVSSPLINF